MGARGGMKSCGNKAAGQEIEKEKKGKIFALCIMIVEGRTKKVI